MILHCGFLSYGRRLCAALALLPTFANASCDFSGIDQRVQALLAQDGIGDGAVLIGSPTGILHKAYFGAYSDTTVIAVASASKLLAGVRILQLVDKGILSLDTPLSTYIPYDPVDFPWSATAAPITLRQMFSHTAGYGDEPDNPDEFNGTITLQQSVERIASNYNNYAPQNYLPAGSLFAYGGISMQIGGYVAQAETGTDWEQGWQNAIGAPMCVDSIDWQGTTVDKSHHTLNYPIAGGAESSLDDYARVLAMLASGGVGNGTRLLSAAAIATLDHSQTGDAILGYAPAAADDSTLYGIGAWIEPSGTSVDTPTISSIGAYGFAPWVDFSDGTFGIVMVYDNDVLHPDAASTNSHDAILDIIADVRALSRDNGGSCSAVAIYDNVFTDGYEASPLSQCPGIVDPQ